MRWNGKEDNLIDRFDGRALLDILPTVNPAPIDDDEESNFNFERYRALLHHLISHNEEDEVIAGIAMKVAERDSALRAPTSIALARNKEKAALRAERLRRMGKASKESNDEDEEEEDDLEHDYEKADEEHKRMMEDLAAKFGIKRFRRVMRLELVERKASKIREKGEKEDREAKEATRGEKRARRRERRRGRERERRRREQEIKRLYRDEGGAERSRRISDDDDDSFSDDDDDDYTSSSDSEGETKEGGIKFISSINIVIPGNQTGAPPPEAVIEKPIASIAKTSNRTADILNAARRGSGNSAALASAANVKKELMNLTKDTFGKKEEKSAPVVETPAERMRKKMLLQLDLKVRQDKDAAAKKKLEKINEEKRNPVATSKERSRSRSKSPRTRKRSRSRSYSRSRSRSRSRDRRSRSRSRSRSPKRSHHRNRRSYRKRSVSRSRSRSPSRSRSRGRSRSRSRSRDRATRSYRRKRSRS
eukprot:TRINITY_DN5226_c0_g1_i2.p1 TRINITY_DN5226_c0_g1~~TRINITY_DN5226_c0_g1_i2.p1  ORF type:complete len:478 (+),score=98.26 TRINITY_DN5226_c0_g1_i2:509-1942(+)